MTKKSIVKTKSNPIIYFKQRNYYFSLIFVVIALILFSASFYSCKNYNYQFELRQVDTLITMNKMAEQIMIVESKKVQDRIDSMIIKVDFFKTLDTNRISGELKFDIGRYKGFLSNYQTFTNSYEVLQYDCKVIKNNLTTLKKKIIDREIPQEEFKEIYYPYKIQTQNNLKDARSSVRNIFSQEKMYQRVNNKISKFYKQQISKKYF